MFSDNGTNFVGASRELERDFRTFLSESRARMCSTYGINGLTWRFIPAGAPHMGGLWEAGVRSFKLHFRKEAKSVKYTFEELSTVLARIEACLNSRPLCPMSDDPNEPVALTPGHFLIGSPILAPPEPSIYESPISLINRYMKVKALTHHFCKRWKEEYLSNLHKRYKWKYPERDIAVGDLVVIKNEQMSPTSWKLGRVVKTYPGSDEHVRVADIRTEMEDALLESDKEVMDAEDQGSKVATVTNPAPASIPDPVPAPKAISVPATAHVPAPAPATASSHAPALVSAPPLAPELPA